MRAGLRVITAALRLAGELNWRPATSGDVPMWQIRHAYDKLYSRGIFGRSGNGGTTENSMGTALDSGTRRRDVLARLFTEDGELKAGLQDVPPLNSAEVAALFQMSERAIRVWAAKGELPHMRTLGGGRLLYPADRIAALYALHYSDAVPRRSSAQVAASTTECKT